jgi:hypothetical protein
MQSAATEGGAAVKIDHSKLQELLSRDLSLYAPDLLRREGNVFFVGGLLPEQETLETLFESHFQSNAALFHLNFGALEDFAQAERLTRLIKKNFNAHLMGRLASDASPQQIERAYAAGIDIIDLPVSPLQEGQEPLPQALACALSVFPRWSVVSSLTAGVAPAQATIAAIDALLAHDVIPLVSLSDGAVQWKPSEAEKVYVHLNSGWRHHKAAIKPLLPLIQLVTPLVPAQSRGVLRGFIDLIDDRRLLATSDLRRVLRVKEVEESYASSGL